MNQPANKLGRFRVLLGRDEDEPLSGVGNLFDIALVLVVALLVAMVANSPQQTSLPDQVSADPTPPNQPSTADRIQETHPKLPHYRASTDSLAGNGIRLGTAYRLESGEVIYVPE